MLEQIARDLLLLRIEHPLLVIAGLLVTAYFSVIQEGMSATLKSCADPDIQTSFSEA